MKGMKKTEMYGKGLGKAKGECDVETTPLISKMVAGWMPKGEKAKKGGMSWDGAGSPIWLKK